MMYSKKKKLQEPAKECKMASSVHPPEKSAQRVFTSFRSVISSGLGKMWLDEFSEVEEERRAVWDACSHGEDN